MYVTYTKQAPCTPFLSLMMAPHCVMETLLPLKISGELHPLVLLKMAFLRKEFNLKDLWRNRMNFLVLSFMQQETESCDSLVGTCPQAEEQVLCFLVFQNPESFYLCLSKYHK